MVTDTKVTLSIFNHTETPGAHHRVRLRQAGQQRRHRQVLDWLWCHWRWPPPLVRHAGQPQAPRSTVAHSSARGGGGRRAQGSHSLNTDTSLQHCN